MNDPFLYFGRLHNSGFYVYTQHGTALASWPADYIQQRDMSPEILVGPDCRKAPCGEGDQPQGLARCTWHPEIGRTCIAFWDRSGDHRMGSSSSFWILGHVGFDDGIAQARAAFPFVFERMTFEVREAPAPATRGA